jgi:signal transduction histidine kinase
VESTQLSVFYHSLSYWPRSDGELSSVAELIARMFDAPFGALILNSSPERLAYRFTDSQAHEKARALAFGESLRKQLQKMNGDLTSHVGIKQLQLLPDSSAFSGLASARFLSVANVLGTPTHGSGPMQDRKHFGWVTIATEKPLSAKHEVMLMAVAQHLGELGMVHDLESAISIRNQFLSIASHELKTPLTSIYGILQLQERMLRLRKDDPLDQQIDRQHSFLRMVIRQVERLNELIDGLLDVSRIQSGRFVVDPSDTDVAMILHDLLSTRLAVIAKEAGVRLEVEAPEALTAWVDPVRIEEVITNLVMNAIRFSPEGGVVRVRLSSDRPTDRSGNGDSLRLSVRDQGPSVPAEDRERIFQPFERAQRTSRLGGLGLGLFISREIAQLHGGNVSLVESVPGKGNMFEAYFPIKNSNLISASA